MLQHYPLFIIGLGASLFSQVAMGGLPAKPTPVAPVRMDRVWSEVCEFSEAISTFKVLLVDFRRRVESGQISSEEADKELRPLYDHLNERMRYLTHQAADAVATRRRLDRPVLVSPQLGLGPPDPYDLTDEVIDILNARSLP